MESLYARCVFFTLDAERAVRFYTEQLGFSLDWKAEEEGRIVVFQVGLLGFELILNQTWESWEPKRARAGQGRVFIGLENDQAEALAAHVLTNGIRTEVADWGKPTLVIKDLDGNELFFWPPADDWTAFGIPAMQASREG